VIIQGDVLVALGKIQASALTFLRAATPFAAAGVGGSVPAPAGAAAATASAPAVVAPAAAVAAVAAAPAPAAGGSAPGRRNLVHKTHRTHTVKIRSFFGTLDEAWVLCIPIVYILYLSCNLSLMFLFFVH